MAQIFITQGETTLIDPRTEYADSGWVISEGYAVHYPCYSGTMEYQPSIGLFNGNQYDITYVVDNYTTGVVRVDLGADTGTPWSSNGTFTETFTYTTGDKIKFYSDGGLRVLLLQIAAHTEEISNSSTFTFNEPGKKWGTEYSFLPELMLKFSDRFFSLNNGTLWEHDTNPVYNNFYGVQYPSRVTFVVNEEYKKDKIFFNFRLDAKGRWYAPSLSIPESNQFPNGMLSQLKKNNFKQIDGKLWADILCDMTNPNFATITDPDERRLKALFDGRKMQGGWLIVELECADNTRSEISSVETYYIETNRSF